MLGLDTPASLIGNLLTAAYQISFLSDPRWRGTTPGRRTVRSRVINATEQSPSRRAAVIRQIPIFVNVPLVAVSLDDWRPLSLRLLAVFVIDLLSMLSDGRRQTWHDR